MEGRGRRSYERITRSGVVYSRLSKVKATGNLAHTNQSTLAPWRRRSRERHPIHLGEITLYQPRTSSSSSVARRTPWENRSRRRGANADTACSFPLLRRFAARLFSCKQCRRPVITCSRTRWFSCVHTSLGITPPFSPTEERIFLEISFRSNYHTELACAEW